MIFLSFNDILLKNNISPSDVVLVRHAFTNQGFRDCADKNFIFDYTRHQTNDFCKDRKYMAVFIGEKDFTARFFRLYFINSVQTSNKSLFPKDFPHPEWLSDGVCYDLTESDILSQYNNNIVVKWPGAVSFHNYADKSDKDIISINSRISLDFPGYDNLILPFEELENIINEEYTYKNYQTALSNINAIYLIVDVESGKQYIGSSYGKGGLLSRWKCYVNTSHGNNKELEKLICSYPQRYHAFQFSILKLLPLSISSNEAIDYETLFKEKLLTKKFGLNDN